MGKQQDLPRPLVLLLPPGPLARGPHRRRPPQGSIIVAGNGRAIPFDLVAELLLPPPLRAHNALDLASRLHECPVCFARAGMACWWAQTHAVRSHHAHQSRLNLAIAEDVARYTRSLG
jgi:hypothetical protein